MTNLVNITEAVEITNNRVKPFSGHRQYLATGDLLGEVIGETVKVDYKTKPSRADLLVNEGEIIVARMRATNKVLLIDKEAEDLIVSTGFLTLAPRKGFNARYLAHYFRSGIFQRQKDRYCSGATQKAINNTSFQKLQVPYYSLDEQKRISETLDQVNALHGKRKRSLQHLNEFLKSAFLDMFGDPVRNPKTWDLDKIGNICSAESGGTPSTNQKEYWENGDIPWLGSTCCKDNFVGEPTAYITKEGLENSSVKIFKKKTVLVALVGATIGKTGFLTFDSTTNQNIAGLYPLKDGKIAPEYLFFSMQFLYPKFLALGRSGFKMANLTFVRNLSIPLPPEKLQQKFADIVQKAGQLKEEQRESEEELNNLFNSLMQRAFKGQLTQ